LKELKEKQMHQKQLVVQCGARLSIATGELEYGHEDRMVTLLFYKAVKGSRLHLLSDKYEYAIATYSLDRNLSYIYSYSYQKEQNWTTYNHDMTANSYRQDDYIFQNELYFRVNLRRIDNGIIESEEAKNINNILQFFTQEETYTIKEYYTEEIKKSAKTINSKIGDNSLVFFLFSDSHYVINGTWEDTKYNIKTLMEEVKFDGIIHLGDFTDGMVPASVTKNYVTQILTDLRENQLPLYITLGNHDSNYFHNNPQPFTEKEMEELYFSHCDTYICRNSNQLYYYVDYNKANLRGIFLSSFDYRENIRYGFCDEEIEWLIETLNSTPMGYSIIVFSHVPPLARLHYWSKTIRNGDKLMHLLETFNRNNKNKILAFIHGHNHADQIFQEGSIPIISIGCAKCEYFTDKKPENSVAYSRTLNTVTQELWDTMVISPAENRIDFIRFGAGDDRTIMVER
jgi:predicted phosphodiesterase